MDRSQQMRNSGIALVGDLPWGSHFCQFYRTKEDLLDILVPYFRAGLEANEFCVWVTSDFFTAEEALAVMRERVPKFQEYLDKGQMEIFPHTEWHLKGGSFDLKRTLQMWQEKHDDALAAGFDGLRVTGAPHWLDNKKDWDDFACYEAAINDVVHELNLLVLCAYSLVQCGVVEIMDVIRNHEFALAMNHGTWQVVRMQDLGTATCASTTAKPA